MQTVAGQVKACRGGGRYCAAECGGPETGEAEASIWPTQPAGMKLPVPIAMNPIRASAWPSQGATMLPVRWKA
jgi:hypothetical protein